MSIKFSTTSFTIESTGDQSPTLRLPGDGESMHHSGGAASETRYIYKDPMDWAYTHKGDSTTCVVGLGLAYIEIAWALGRLQQIDVVSSKAQLISYEKEAELRTIFNSWLNSAEQEAVYCDIAKALGADPKDMSKIQNRLQNNFKANPICEDLLCDQNRRQFNIVCYDAFSSKTNTELWSFEFLNQFIENKCAEDCLFTTYACTGHLKNVLRERGFLFIKRPGFQGKRDASLALRGLFKQAYETSSYQIF